ncbi:long-chain-fatty-acid--CoA ligase [Thalassovita sp.]|uniref:long-chain-fatty-acid--CoA ligase n=1 Tax=Thalassovita sp. TaxID=1979401 RepID=UPI003B5ADA96
MFDRHLSVWPKSVPRQIAFPRHTLCQNLARSAAKFADRPAIIYHGHTLTYAQLHQMVEALAGYLQNRLNVKRGDRVLLYMQNSPQAVISYYAILRADAAVVPVNPMSQRAELQHYATDAGARVMLAGQELLPHAQPLIDAGALGHVLVANYKQLADPEYDIPLPDPLAGLDPEQINGPGITRWSDAIDANERPAPAQATPEDLAVIPYSSGTTGAPKGCVHTHFSVQAVCEGGLNWNPMYPDDVSLSVLPFFHVTGMQTAMNMPIASGGVMVIMTRWNREVAAELIKRYRVTRWRSIATMAIDLVNDDKFDSYDLSSLKAIGGGGAAMPEAIAKKLKDMTGLDYVEGYGMSETIGATHTNPVDAPKRQCLGIPMFDVDSRVINPATLDELGPNETGEIIMAGPQIFQGYWNNPAATDEVFMHRDGKTFLRTGDLGYYDEDGYFFMVDRVKRMINAAGFKVWPAEVEAMMLKHPNIAEACVISTTDPRRGESVKAVIIPRGQVCAQDIITWCRSEMAAYKCPRVIEFVDELPKSGSGKVLWRELQDKETAQDP